MNRLINIATIVIACCALVVTYTIVRRGNTPPPPPPTQVVEPRTRVVEDWKSYDQGGHQLGSPAGKVRMVIFSDFECPFCGGFAREDLHHVLVDYQGAVSVTFRHFPIPKHRFAHPSALAAECAAAQGAFPAFHDQLFQHQDSLGLISYSAFASRSGVADLPMFDSCIKRSADTLGIAADLAAGLRLGINATPTILINSVLYRGRPPRSTLDSLLRSAIAAKP